MIILPSADTAICRDLDGYSDYRPDLLGKARECRENSRLRPPLEKGQPEQRQKHKRESYLACTVISAPKGSVDRCHTVDLLSQASKPHSCSISADAVYEAQGVYVRLEVLD